MSSKFEFFGSATLRHAGVHLTSRVYEDTNIVVCGSMRKRETYIVVGCSALEEQSV